MNKEELLIVLSEALAWNKLMASATEEHCYYSRIEELKEMINQYGE